MAAASGQHTSKRVTVSSSTADQITQAAVNTTRLQSGSTNRFCLAHPILSDFLRIPPLKAVLRRGACGAENSAYGQPYDQCVRAA